MVDPQRVRRLLDMLDTYRGHLMALRALPVEDYEGAVAFAGRYLVQAAAQTCIDVANHMIASEGWRVPKDYRDAFTVLEEHAVTEPDLSARLRALTGLRNRLVHLYDDVDDGLVHGFLREGLADLERFSTSVAAVVSEDEGRSP